MDIHAVFSSTSDADHKGARTALVAELQRIGANHPQQVLARFTEPDVQGNLAACSARYHIERISAESRSWAQALQGVIEAGKITRTRLLDFRSNLEKMLDGLAQAKAQAEADSEEAVKSRELEAKLADAHKTISQLATTNETLAIEIARQAATNVRQTAKIENLEAENERTTAKLVEQAKQIAAQGEAIADLKQRMDTVETAASANRRKRGTGKRETPYPKVPVQFTRKAHGFLDKMERGAVDLGVAHGIDKGHPIFGAAHLWRAMHAVDLISVELKEETLNGYASSVLKDRGYTLKPGRPKEDGGSQGVDFLVDCYQAGKASMGKEGTGTTANTGKLRAA